MNLQRKVSTREVKRCYLIAGRKPRKGRLTSAALKRQLASTKKKILSLTTDELDAILVKEWKGTRLRAYDSCDWYLGTVKPSEVGVWTRAGELPLRWTNGSLAETAVKVARGIKDRRLSGCRAASAIPGVLRTDLDDLQKEKYLLPIIFQGGTGTRGRRRLKRKMKGDIDDGCMRSIALTISGRKTITAYIGIPKKT